MGTTREQCEALVFRAGSIRLTRCRLKATTTVANYRGSTETAQICTIHNPDLKAERRANRPPTAAELRSGLIAMAHRTAETAKARILELEQQVQAMQVRIKELEEAN